MAGVVPAGHPVRLVVTDDLVRSRLVALFRLPLAIPHVVWLGLWSVAALLAVLAAWLAALRTRRVPLRLHSFLAAYLRYATHVVAFVDGLGRRFPGFTGREGSFGVDLVVTGPERQGRGQTALRLLLALPALLVTGVLAVVLLAVGLVAWCWALARGSMPRRLRDLGVACLGFAARTLAYALLLTDRYPSARR